MSELKKRLAPMEHLQMPELWEDIRRRPAPDHPVEASGVEASRHRRIVTILVAAAVIAIPFAGLWLGFRHQPASRPEGSTPSSQGGEASHSPSSVELVPDVVGLSLRDAARSVEALSLVVGGVSGGAVSDANAVVVEQDPAPGTEVDSGTTVDLVLSNPAGASGVAISIDGVPFKVCRPITVAGTFGGDLDTAWVFEEERVPGAGCIGSEGFQRLGVGNWSHVQLLSDRITDALTDDAWKVWPYAAPDLNGDGVDEIAVAKQGDQGSSRSVWFFQVVGQDKLVPVFQKCGPGCDPVPFNTLLGSGSDQDGAITESGMYCTPKEGSGSLIIEWRASSDNPLLISETRSVFSDGLLNVVSYRSDLVASVEDYPPSGIGDLCGSPTYEP